jgi:VPDSG-CTERM motif
MSKSIYINKLRTFSPGKIWVAVLGFMGIGLFQAAAVPVTVQEVGIGANEVVQMTSSTLGTQWVYAGTVNLLVNGVATQGFCIDPFHWSITGPQAYDSEPLGVGPKSPGGPMGAGTALKIEQLWAQYYSIGMSSQNAAGLQIAIWDLVGGANFQLDSSPDYGAGAMLTWVNNNPNASAADLIAVTGPGQDYVIPNGPNIPQIPGVPDGGTTALLLGMGLTSLIVMRSKFLAVAASK